MKPVTPRTLDWADAAPVRASRSRRIAATPDAVWAVIADHERWTDWFPRLTRVVPGERAEGVGGTRRVEIGKTAVDEEFLAWEPGARFAFTATGAEGAPLKGLVEDIRLTPDGEGATTVTYTMCLDVPGAKVLAPVLGAALRKSIGDGLAGLAGRVGG